MRNLFFLLFPAMLIAQDSLNISLLGKTELWGISTTMMVRDHFAYVGLYSGEIVILDVSDPAAPVEIQRQMISDIPDQLTDGDSLLIATISDDWYENGTIEIYRFQENGTLSFAGEVEYQGHGAPQYTSLTWPWLMAQDWGSFKVWNITDLANPVLMDEPDMNGSPVVDGGLLYLWHTNYDTNPWTYSLQIREYEPPSNFPLISELPLGNVGLSGFDVEAGRAVVAQNDTILFIDVSNPNTPIITSRLYGNSGIRGVDLQGDLVSVVTRAQWLALFDVQSIDNPYLISHVEISDWGSGVQLVGDQMYVHSGVLSGFEIFDVSNPSSPVRVGYYFRYIPYGGGGVIDGKLVYAIQGNYSSSYSVGIVDISNPGAPHFSLPKVFAENISVDNGFIFGSVGNSLVVGALTPWGEINPGGAIQLGEVGQDLSQISVSDGIAYCACLEDGVLYVVDVSDPAIMSLLEEIHDIVGPALLASDDGIASVITNHDSLVTVDARNPENIHLASSIPIDVTSWGGVAMSGSLLAHSGSPNGLVFEDVSDPAHPISYPVFEGSENYRRIKLSEGRLFKSYRGLKCLDVTVPAAPVVYAYYNDPTLESGYIFIEGNRAICVGGDLSIFDISGTVDAGEPPVIPDQFELTVFPNPFNNETRITFDVPRAGNAKVEVFDVTGRIVETLVDSRLEAGTHSYKFGGDRLASGVYFVRGNVSGLMKTAKLVLLR